MVMMAVRQVIAVTVQGIVYVRSYAIPGLISLYSDQIQAKAPAMLTHNGSLTGVCWVPLTLCLFLTWALPSMGMKCVTRRCMLCNIVYHFAAIHRLQPWPHMPL